MLFIPAGFSSKVMEYKKERVFFRGLNKLVLINFPMDILYSKRLTGKLTVI